MAAKHHDDLRALNEALARLIEEVDAAREILVAFDGLCQRYGCPNDRDRLSWLDEKLHEIIGEPPSPPLNGNPAAVLEPA